MQQYALATAGVVFGLVALLHLFRLFLHFPIIIGTTTVPDSASIIGLLIAGGLSAWMFISLKNK